jgi:predicted nucleotidyltransferase
LPEGVNAPTLDDVANESPLPGECAAIARALSPHDDIDAALLFGSRAKGTHTPQSDFDIAVLLNKAPASLERKDVLRRLIGALGREFNAEREELRVPRTIRRISSASPTVRFHAH